MSTGINTGCGQSMCFDLISDPQLLHLYTSSWNSVIFIFCGGGMSKIVDSRGRDVVRDTLGGDFHGPAIVDGGV